MSGTILWGFRIVRFAVNWNRKCDRISAEFTKQIMNIELTTEQPEAVAAKCEAVVLYDDSPWTRRREGISGRGRILETG